jgi:hypothetical protein
VLPPSQGRSYESECVSLYMEVHDPKKPRDGEGGELCLVWANSDSKSAKLCSPFKGHGLDSRKTPPASMSPIPDEVTEFFN